MSRACVASQSRWLAMRESSPTIERMYCARMGISQSKNFSTAVTHARLFEGAAM